jgi:hypothetical protein
MAMKQRPWAVLIVAVVYLITGAVGLVYHLWAEPFTTDLAWVSAVRLLAVVAGVGLLWRQNWARWLAAAWMAFHVVIGFFHSWFQAGMHTLFLAVIVVLLFTGRGGKWFARE